MRFFTKAKLKLGVLFFAGTLFLPATMNGQAYTLQDDDVEVNEKGYITSCTYDFSNKDIVIPSTLDNVQVNGIDNEVFKEKGIESVYIPATVRNIGNKAFYYNNLKSVTIEANSSLHKIGASAFGSNRYLESIVLPTNTNLGFIKYFDSKSTLYNPGDEISEFYRSYSAQIPYALKDEDVTIEEGVIKECSYDYTYTDIIIPNILNGQTVVGIEDGSTGSGVFYNTPITSVTIPSSIKKIGQYVFDSSDIFEVNFEANSNIQLIGEAAFKWNHLSTITLPTHASSDFRYYQGEDGNKYNPGDEITNFEMAYISVAPYTLTNDDVVVLDGVIQSCTYNFESKGIVIPNELDGQTIVGVADYAYYGSSVFYDKGISFVEFPNTLETIGSNSFSSNELMVLEFPASLKELKSFAFYLNELKTVKFLTPSKLEKIMSNVFYGNYGVEISLPESHVLGNNVIFKDTEGTEYKLGEVIENSGKDIVASVVNGIHLDWKSNKNILIGPNPASEYVNISGNDLKGGVIEIYNSTGELQKTEIVHRTKVKVNISDFSAGVYIFLYRNNVIGKVMKNK